MNVAFLGLHGIPYSREASDIRILSFAQSIINKGNGAIIFNKYPVRKKKEREIDIPLSDSIKIIEVLNIDPQKNKFIRQLLFLISYPYEFVRVVQNNSKSKIDILHIYTGHFFDLFFYYFLARVIKAKVVYQYVEFRSEIKRPGIYHRINGYLIDYYGKIFYDGVICISNYIVNHIKTISPNMPIIKIPPVCDFSIFDSVKGNINESNYLLYCGSAGYFDVIKFVIDSYDISKCKAYGITLLIIISGSQKEVELVKKYTKGNNNIEIISDLLYTKLINFYKNAKALLIPIRNTIQDIARFPNKICEYTASKSVIITVNNGEIPFYFENEVNAVISEEYSVRCFADKIDWVLENENRLDNLKENGYNLGKLYFDIQAYAASLGTFLDQVKAK